jgi:hypothetical protein
MVEQAFQTRGDQVSEFGTPLRRFWGRLVTVHPPQRSGNMKHPNVKLDFASLKVIDFPPDSDGVVKKGSMRPYPYPVAEIEIMYWTAPSGQLGNIGWGGLVKSAEENCQVNDFADLVGKNLLMTTETEEYTDSEDNKKTSVNWRLEEVEGMGSAVEDEGAHLAQLADGKDATQFTQAALQDPIGRKNTNQIMDGEMLPSLVAAKKLTVDEAGIYHIHPDDLPL